MTWKNLTYNISSLLYGVSSGMGISFNSVGIDKMENEIELKKMKARNQVEALISKMADYLKCGKQDIKIARIIFANGIFSADLSYRYIDHFRSDQRKIITSIYYFDIEGEYLEKEGIRYEGIFYNYDNLEPFFEVIRQEIDELSKK